MGNLGNLYFFKFLGPHRPPDGDAGHLPPRHPPVRARRRVLRPAKVKCAVSHKRNILFKMLKFEFSRMLEEALGESLRVKGFENWTYDIENKEGAMQVQKHIFFKKSAKMTASTIFSGQTSQHRTSHVQEGGVKARARFGQRNYKKSLLHFFC